MEKVPSIIDPESKKRFERDGYLVIDLGLSEVLIDRIVEKTMQAYPPEFLQNPTFATRLQDAWMSIDEVRQLATHPQVMAALRAIWGRRPRPFQTLNFPIGTSQREHSDTIHFNCQPQGYMCGVWVAFEDIEEDNGPLIYYPGSHLLQEYAMQDFGLEPGYDNYPDYEQCVAELIEKEGLKPELGLVKRGQAIIWHANLLHGGYVQRDATRSRHSQVTHYYFSGCKYYTPMDSSLDRVAYRQPAWIGSKPYRSANALQRHILRLRQKLNLSG